MSIYLDDRVISGPSEQDHMKNLEEVLNRLQKSELRLKRSKCESMGKEVAFLGHKIHTNGLYPLTEKVEAREGAHKPQNVMELIPYLGLFNYYHRFLPKLSMPLTLLHALLKKIQNGHGAKSVDGI